MNHLHTISPAEVQAQWAGWDQLELTDDEIICHIAVARACEIVAKKHRWDINYCFEAITYTPIIVKGPDHEQRTVNNTNPPQDAQPRR
jgi:hypothetical protein